jgi:UDP-N-acetylglucosamine 2-epimerase (non-hydrolysing)
VNARPELKILREDELREKVAVVVGTRPGIVMFSPIIRELERRRINYFIIHTGQHYSPNMDRRFFEDLKLPAPRYKLEHVQHCQYHGEQTAEMLKGCEQVLLKERPKIVLVGGDANTNLAGALAARKLRIRVGHVEAGERSYDWRMPEEHNRVIIDHISEYLFTTNEKGRENLLKDHIQGKVFVTGNPIVDAAFQNLEIAKESSNVLERFRLEPDDYFVLTLHREENVDILEHLEGVLEGSRRVIESCGTKIVFPAHPRTLRRLNEFGLNETAQCVRGLQIYEAVGYLDFLQLLANARLTLTDSGGVQQESCILHIPCVTLRENTEWTETLEIGANALAGTDPERIAVQVEKMLRAPRNWPDPFGDGRSAERIVEIVTHELRR